jgi:hypothetical protein
LAALIVVVVLTCGASLIATFGGESLPYAIGQRIDQPIYAEVDFKIRDEKATREARQAAGANTPSYYTPNAPSISTEAIRADLIRLYQAAAGVDSFEAFAAAMKVEGWPENDEAAYRKLRSLVEPPEDRGRELFREWVAELPLEGEYVVRDLPREPRTPKSVTDYIMLEIPGPDGSIVPKRLEHRRLVPQGNDRALDGSAVGIAKRFPALELRGMVEAIVLRGFRKQPTIVFNQERTAARMRTAETATLDVFITLEKGRPFVDPYAPGSDGRLTPAQYELLGAHQAEYERFLASEAPGAGRLRTSRLLHRFGLVAILGMLFTALGAYVGMHQPRLFVLRSHIVSLVLLVLGTLLFARGLELRWPQYPELTLTPMLMAASILAIVYPQRFALGVMAILGVVATVIIGGGLNYLLLVGVGVAFATFPLQEIRSRTKIISAGVVAAVAVAFTSAAGALLDRQALDYVRDHALWSAAATLASAFAFSGVLPFIERMFSIATALTLLEWRDPTKPLLQLLAREAPGTYTHSLVLGTLADAACSAIGANGLLAQVGALYHDIGKIHKARYFTENQEGRLSRHENLSPTLSLLIILAHVKDGLEMAREYKLPKVLHQFIEEHHGTTVVRYFHHMASEKQPHIASGRHDREVPEADFRYSGPKPRARESAVLMLCDGVEGAVRSLSEPTPGRIESTVHQIVMARLNDGQFDNCDITLKEIHKVEESLVKSLCSIYHGRVAYPKERKGEDGRAEESAGIPRRPHAVRPAAG